jgi:hypothetical protein
MPNATLEQPVVVEKAETLIRQRYAGYKVTPLFTNGKTEYFRCTRWGVDAEGNAKILRQAFVMFQNGEITERPD